MAPDGRTDGRMDGWTWTNLYPSAFGGGRKDRRMDGNGQTYIPPPSAGDNNKKQILSFKCWPLLRRDTNISLVELLPLTVYIPCDKLGDVTVTAAQNQSLLCVF